MALLLHKFKGNGLYILDEPEIALSPNRQLSAIAANHHFVKDASSLGVRLELNIHEDPTLIAYSIRV